MSHRLNIVRAIALSLTAFLLCYNQSANAQKSQPNPFTAKTLPSTNNTVSLDDLGRCWAAVYDRDGEKATLSKTDDESLELTIRYVIHLISEGVRNKVFTEEQVFEAISPYSYSTTEEDLIKCQNKLTRFMIADKAFSDRNIKKTEDPHTPYHKKSAKINSELRFSDVKLCEATFGELVLRTEAKKENGDRKRFISSVNLGEDNNGHRFSIDVLNDMSAELSFTFFDSKLLYWDFYLSLQKETYDSLWKKAKVCLQKMKPIAEKYLEERWIVDSSDKKMSTTKRLIKKGDCSYATLVKTAMFTNNGVMAFSAEQENLMDFRNFQKIDMVPTSSVPGHQQKTAENIKLARDYPYSLIVTRIGNRDVMIKRFKSVGHLPSTKSLSTEDAPKSEQVGLIIYGQSEDVSKVQGYVETIAFACQLAN